MTAKQNLILMIGIILILLNLIWGGQFSTIWDVIKNVPQSSNTNSNTAGESGVVTQQQANQVAM